MALDAGAQAIILDAASTINTGASGIIDITAILSTTASSVLNIDVESEADTATEEVNGIFIQMDDDADNADNELHGIHVQGDGVNGTGLQHAIIVQGANIDAGVWLETGYLRVGTGGTPGQSLGAADNVYVEGTVEVDGNLYPDGTIVGDGATTMVGVNPLGEVVAATNVITAAECGSVFFLSHGTEFQSTLPAMSTCTAGCTFEFYVEAAPSGASYTILTGNTDEDLLIGGVVERDVDTGDDGPYDASADTITFVNNVSVVGDMVRIVASGNYWYVTGVANADGGITITDSD